MPYIDNDYRRLIDPGIDDLAQRIRTECGSDQGGGYKWAGVMNYATTRLLLKTLPAKRYWAMALGIGTLVCVIFEFYRRFVGKYEDEAIAKNGDIPEYKEAA